MKYKPGNIINNEFDYIILDMTYNHFNRNYYLVGKLNEYDDHYIVYADTTDRDARLLTDIFSK